MKMTGRAFARKLFGAKYERLLRAVLIDLIVFWGLYTAGLSVQIAAGVRNFMTSAITACIMWQALSAKDTAVELRHMLMLPFRPGAFVFSYVAVLGVYVLAGRAGLLLAVLLAVSARKPGEILMLAVCTVHAVLAAAAVRALGKYRFAGGLFAAAAGAVILMFGDRPWFSLLLCADGIIAVLVLWRAGGYVFYTEEGRGSRRVKSGKRALLLRYFFRYMSFHRNYMANTAAMSAVALVLPFFLGKAAGQSAVFTGFGILSLNTPVCILLSCDRGLEQAVRFLPGQKRAFGIPCVQFIFLCNMAVNVLFLCSWQIQNGGLTVLTAAACVFFALQSAVLSALLEWFYPIRSWKIESDLWHHPRKYAVPAVMLLLAGAVSGWPAVLPVLSVLLIGEIAVLLWKCRR